jgi:hypothetical protein
MRIVRIPSQRAIDSGATLDPRAAAMLALAVRAGLAAAAIAARRAAGEARAALARLLSLLAGPDRGADTDEGALDRYRGDDEPAPFSPAGIRLPVFASAP